jgi:hypothetical protein
VDHAGDGAPAHAPRHRRYGADPAITSLLKSTELWFVPVANPDGYDYTFSTERFWRKNLRDNNGDGQITVGDGVDLNRNYATKWGWDNEGSSPDPASETYRGPAPASEPETQAVDRLLDRVGSSSSSTTTLPRSCCSTASAGRCSTPARRPHLRGDGRRRRQPGRPGYDPDISAELYTVNGETLMQAAVHNGTLGFTPEMSTCQTASDSNPDDEWLAEDCLMRLRLPRRRGPHPGRVRQERALRPRRRAVRRRPRRPRLGGRPDGARPRAGRVQRLLRHHPAGGRPGQASPGDKRLRYSVNGGPTRTASVSEWNGGERYGDGYDRYIAEYRGTVTGTSAGDSVRVWFTAKRGKTTVTSPDFTYQVATDIGGDVLVLAAEDVTGASPAQTARARSTPRRTPPTSRPPATPRTCTTWTPMAVAQRTTSGCCRTTTRWCGRPATTSFRE